MGFNNDDSDSESSYYNSRFAGDEIIEFKKSPDRDVEQMKKTYGLNKSAKVGSLCQCPTCNKPFVKKSYQQAFDSTKCKDGYWNTVDLKRKSRAKIYSR